MTEEQRFLDMLPKLPDLQCAWILLLMCAVPRANHWLRTTPPPENNTADARDQYPAVRDKAIWATLLRLLGHLPDAPLGACQQRAQLPGR